MKYKEQMRSLATKSYILFLSWLSWVRQHDFDVYTQLNSMKSII